MCQGMTPELSLEGKRRKGTGSSLAKTPRRAGDDGAGIGETATCSTIAPHGGRARGAIDRHDQAIGEGLRVSADDLQCGRLETRAERGGRPFGHREGQSGLRATRLLETGSGRSTLSTRNYRFAS